MTTPSDEGPVVKPGTAASSGSRSKEEIEADIEATRAQLGQTVDALSQRLDVKARLKAEAQLRRERAARQLQAQRVQVTQQLHVRRAQATRQLHSGRAQATRQLQVRREQVRQQPAIPVAVAAGVALLTTTLVVWRLRRRKG